MPVITIFGESLDTSSEHYVPRAHGRAGSAPLDELLRLRALPRLRSASFCDFPLGDAGLGYLCELPTLTSLSLQNARISDEGLASLRRLPGLRHLRLKDNPQLGDACVRHLRQLVHLVGLQVHETSITAAGLAELAALEELRELCVDDETGGCGELAELSRRLPRCEILVKGHGTFVAGDFSGEPWP